MHSSSILWVLTDAGEQSCVSLSEAKGSGSTDSQWEDFEVPGIQQNQVGIWEGSACECEVLVVDRQLLSFDFLLGINVMKELGDVYLTESGEAHFGNLNRCATILIYESDFSTTFRAKKC